MIKKGIILNWSKAALLVICMVGSQFAFAQTDTSVTDKNKSKINELNERLDNLVKSTSTVSSGDSVEIKLNILLKQMMEVKQEMASMKSAINTMSEENKQAREEYKKGNGIADNLEEGKYYVVIGSRRNQALAEALLKELSKNNQVKMVKNHRDTWNHIILTQSFSREEAAKKVQELRQGTFTDSWWTTAKRLQ